MCEVPEHPQDKQGSIRGLKQASRSVASNGKNRSEFGGPENIDPNARVAASEGSKVEEPPGQPDVTSRRQARAHEAAAPRHQLADLAAEDARLRGDVAAALRLYDIPHCQLETERTAFEGRAKALQEAEERLRRDQRAMAAQLERAGKDMKKCAERQARGNVVETDSGDSDNTDVDIVTRNMKFKKNRPAASSTVSISLLEYLSR
ncbi:hypothetical protein FB451DRAFT_1536051 [Mycena latifolia]|nr:hypothetical protein FB451DRAFT_1536051 [Mycena latifolia]